MFYEGLIFILIMVVYMSLGLLVDKSGLKQHPFLQNKVLKLLLFIGLFYFMEFTKDQMNDALRFSMNYVLFRVTYFIAFITIVRWASTFLRQKFND